jgi:hypothetical protein
MLNGGSIAATRLAIHLKGFGIEEQADQRRTKAVPMRLFLKTALQTLREHDQESWVLFVDLVKATIQSTEMLWKILTTLGVPESLISAQKLYTDTINLRVGEKLEQFLSTSGVKQGDNLAPVLFIFHHAVSNTLDKKWDFTTPDFRWFPDTQVGSKPRGQLRGTNHSRAQCSRSSSPIMSTIRPSFSAAESDRRLKLIVSHFRRFGLTIHTGSRRKGEDSNGGHSLQAWTWTRCRLLILRDMEIDAGVVLSESFFANLAGFKRSWWKTLLVRSAPAEALLTGAQGLSPPFYHCSLLSMSQYWYTILTIE